MRIGFIRILTFFLTIGTLSFSQDKPWESLGPNAGSVRGITYDKDSGYTYAASFPGGIYKRTDEKFLLKIEGMNFSYFPSANDISINPGDSRYLLAAVENTVYYSNDGADSWNPTNIFSNGVVIKAKFLNDTIAAACAYLEQEIYVSTDRGQSWSIKPVSFEVNKMTVDTSRHIIYLNNYNEIFKSTDLGDNWVQVNFPLTTGIHDINIGSRTGDMLVIADKCYFSSTPGANWNILDTDFPGLSWSVIEDPFKDSVYYLGANKGVYKWTPETGKWTETSNGLFELQLGNEIKPTVINLYANPSREDQIFAGTERAGFYQTGNGGIAWQRTGVPASVVYDMEIEKDPFLKIIAAGDRGVQISNEYGWDNTPLFSDIGSARIVLKKKPDNHNTIYTGGLTLSKSVLSVSTNQGMTWDSFIQFPSTGWLTSIAFHPQNSNKLFAGSINGPGSFGLYSTLSGGFSDTSWNGVAGSELWHIGAVGISPVDYSIYAVEITGEVYKSTDNGTTFIQSGAVTVGKDDYVTGIVIDSATNYIYITGTGIQVSTDGGVNFEQILPGEFVHDLLIDNLNNDYLYAATLYNGVMVSSDRGSEWKFIKPRIPTFNVTCLLIDEDNSQRHLYAGTYGGSVYRIGIGYPTSIRDTRSVIENFYLSQNYPNPFNPSTRITFSLPSGDIVNLKVFNTLGEEVKTLLSGYKEGGVHSVTFNADDLSGGIYFCRITTGKYTAVSKMLLLK
jgi:photosystem II stability/assembly factor-like uncharacterized protein